MSKPKLIITEQKTFSWYLLCGGVLVVVLAASYMLGRFYAKQQEESLRQQVAFLEQEMLKYQQAYMKTNEDLVMQVQSAKVDNLSNQQLVETVKSLQSSQKELESELKFYRNIMAPEKDKQGLTIAEFALSQQSAEAKPKFKLVLTQAGKQSRYLSGRVELNLHGKLNGADKVYPFRELGTFKSKAFEFQFKYFQNIEGELSLPDGFVAEYVTVQARTRGLQKNQVAQTQVEWTI